MKKTNQGCRNLLQVEIPSFWETLEKWCSEQNDSYQRMKVGSDFTKLASLEARYHKACHALYIKQYAYSRKQHDLGFCDNAFINFGNEYFKKWKSIKHPNFITEISGTTYKKWHFYD